MPHTDARDYFVSLVRGKRRSLLAGPFSTHAEALLMVERARGEASKVDPWTDFDAVGTCSLPAGSGYVGVLNDRLGLVKMSDALQLSVDSTQLHATVKTSSGQE